MVRIISSLKEWSNIRKQQHSLQSLGMIATMGNLHQGHLSLCKKSTQENDLTLVTIYVNPTQFNDAQDLQNYPRTLEQDVELLQNLGGVDYCLVLSDAEIYQDEFSYQVLETQVSKLMEGEFRPGHFTGMLTIVLKLLCGVAPTRAYFGEKDYQQYLLISKMQSAFFIDCEIIPCPIIRETSGLPFSSRNSRLSLNERRIADEFAQIFLQKQQSLAWIKQGILDLGLSIDYIQEYQGRRLVAVRLGQIRLLDNYAI